MRLVGKTVVVMGAGSAIGRAVCGELGSQGAALGLSDLRGEALKANADEARETGAKVLTQVVDAASTEKVQRFVEEVGVALGPIDGLVNIAGSFRIAGFLDTGQSDWQEMISTNLITTMQSCHAVLPGMLERGSGSIVNFASTAGEYGSIRPAADYAAAKGGVIAFTKSLAREVSPLGIRVNCVSPGPTDTPALQADDGTGRAAAASRTLLGRMGTPKDHAHAVVYLLADESAWVTGTILQVNGGSLL